MKKGKCGLSLSAVAVIAFGFTALRQPQSVLLVTGFALLTERDEWLNRQVMQALLLTVTYYLTELVTGWVFGGLSRFFGWVKLHGAAGVMGTAGTFVSGVLYLTLIVFSVLAALRVLRGKDAGLPFLTKLASGDFVMVIQKRPKRELSPIQPPQPVYAAQEYARDPQLPAQSVPQPDLEAPVQQQATAGRHCFSCGAALQEDSRFCTECGAKNE